MHLGFALGALLGLVVAAIPAASFFRLPAAPAPAAALSVRAPLQPASTRAPHLPPAVHTTMARAEPAQLDGPARSQSLASDPVSPILGAASRPLPRPELLRIARADARLSARNRPVAPSLPGLVSAILGQLNASAGNFRPRQSGDGPALGSIRLPSILRQDTAKKRKILKVCSQIGQAQVRRERRKVPRFQGWEVVAETLIRCARRASFRQVAIHRRHSADGKSTRLSRSNCVTLNSNKGRKGPSR